MAKIITVQGANGQDETKRAMALEKLNDLPTIVLERLAEVSKSQKAQDYFTNPMKFIAVKTFLK